MTKSEVNTCKAVLVGDSGVGKTCIISRFISNTFEKNSMSTACPSFSSKILEYNNIGKSLNMDIWDTAGQELYKSLSKLFYKGASVGILVYDITNIKSFNNIKEFWYNELKTNGDSDMIFCLVANKYDMYEVEQVKEEDGQAYAKSIGAIFYSVSAKDNLHINDIFYQSGLKVLDPSFMPNKDGSGKTPDKKGVKIKDSNREKKGCC